MLTLKLACELIPGYDLLTEDQRATFERTWSGERLAYAVASLDAFDNQSFITRVWSANSRESIFTSEQSKLFEQIENQPDYAQLVRCISFLKIRRILQPEIKKQITPLATVRLQTLYFPYLQAPCAQQIPMLDLDEFNWTQAGALANAILDNKAESVNLWLDEYKKHLQSRFRLVKQPDPTTIEVIEHSMSWFMSQNNVKWGVEILDKFAGSISLFQGTGFALQYESRFFSMLEMYKAARTTDFYGELKYTLFKSLQPFAPLFDEIQDITHREHSLYWQLFRTMMLFLIIAAGILLISIPLAQVVLPELAWVFITLPILYSGLFLASLYVKTKNHLYTAATNYFYGEDHVPELIPGKDMIATFGDHTKFVCKFYTDELRLCKQREIYYKKTPSMQKYQEKNASRSDKLQAEWYDINCNPHLEPRDRHNIMLNRLRQDLIAECKVVNSELSALVDEIAAEIQQNIPSQTRPGPLSHSASHRFFAHKEKSERLNTAVNKFRQSPPKPAHDLTDDQLSEALYR